MTQVFTKLGHETPDNDIDLALLGADNPAAGNQLTPADLLEQRQEAYTHPDEVDNQTWAANLNTKPRLGGGLSLAANLHYRQTQSEARNPDVDEIEDPLRRRTLREDPQPDRAASLNRADLDQNATGLTLQAGWQAQETQRLTAGLAYARGEARYRRSYQLGRFNPDRSVTPVGATVEQVNIDGSTRKRSVFATWHWRPAPRWNLSASARCFTPGSAPVTLDPALPDSRDPTVALRLKPNDYTYQRVNPAFGLSFALTHNSPSTPASEKAIARPPPSNSPAPTATTLPAAPIRCSLVRFWNRW
ncbi:MAG: TonB-dependent receptor [Desulfobacterales bacterium]|nr:TonB-dependent receptor [Desulfobacterales bacterium]